MKKILFSVLAACVVSTSILTTTSCNEDETYAEQKDKEKKAISDADTKPDANNKSIANDMATIAPAEGGITVTPSNNSVKRHKYESGSKEYNFS